MKRKEVIAPFKFGGHVEPAYFVGREKELQSLKWDAVHLVQSNVIIGPRRYGKTWLLQRVKQLVEAESDVLMPYINCLSMNNPLDFNEIIVTNILKDYESRFRTKGLVFSFKRLLAEKSKDMLKRISKIDINLGKLGEMFVEFHDRDEEGTGILRATFEFINNFAEKRDFKMVLIFDEFQKTEDFDHSLYELFKVYMDNTTMVKYFFSGSSLSLLRKVFLGHDSPLYMIATKNFMKPLEEDVVKEYISKQLRLQDTSIDNEALKSFYKLIGGIPSYMQKLGELCAKIRKEYLSNGDIEEAFQLMLNELGADFERYFSERFSNEEQQILKTISSYTSITKTYLIREEKDKVLLLLGSLKDSMIILEDENEEIKIADVVFSQWLKRMGGITV